MRRWDEVNDMVPFKRASGCRRPRANGYERCCSRRSPDVPYDAGGRAARDGARHAADRSACFVPPHGLLKQMHDRLQSAFSLRTLHPASTCCDCDVLPPNKTTLLHCCGIDRIHT